jgi:hypothetical protein
MELALQSSTLLLPLGIFRDILDRLVREHRSVIRMLLVTTRYYMYGMALLGSLLAALLAPAATAVLVDSLAVQDSQEVAALRAIRVTADTAVTAPADTAATVDHLVDRVFAATRAGYDTISASIPLLLDCLLAPTVYLDSTMPHLVQ